MIRETPIHLLEKAAKVASHAHSRYSKFCVGAAVETEDGGLFLGVNMENSSYGVTCCAEVGALQAACTAGKLNQVVRIAVVGGFRDKCQTLPSVVTPCGRCRQLIGEAAMLSGRDLEVWCADVDVERRKLDLESIESFTISELLPRGFCLPELSESLVVANTQ